MPDRIADLYQRHAHAFDAARRRSFPERQWLERFVRTIQRGGEIRDLGCGGVRCASLRGIRWDLPQLATPPEASRCVARPYPQLHATRSR
mgnify:CR=1 FL=1